MTQRPDFSKRAAVLASKFHTINKVVAAGAVLCLSQTVNAQEVAPYFQAWSGSLMDAKNAAGMDRAVLAFAISNITNTTNGSCAFDPTLLDKLPDAKNYVAAGGRLSISFGGQKGVYVEIACKNDDQLFAMMEKLMLDSGARQFDFDIEGEQLSNIEGTARRSRVLARLQAKYPELAISFTLPGWFRGVNANSVDLLNTTKVAGVRIDMVNVMAMSFGADNVRTMVSPSTMAQAVIDTLNASIQQVAAIYPNKTDTQVRAMMGVTPMIGKNDDGTTFTLGDAQTVAKYAKANGIGRISYWSFQRDRVQADGSSTDINGFSGVAQSDFQFYTIFKSAGGDAAPAGSYSNWVQGQQYATGSVVSYAGNLYQAKYANPGYIPTVSTYYWSAYSSNWVQGQQYAADSVVSYADNFYQAKYANPGYIPTVSTYYWSVYPTNWVQGQQYAAGSVVSYAGTLYIAKYANPGYIPTVSTYYWAVYAG